MFAPNTGAAQQDRVLLPEDSAVDSEVDVLVPPRLVDDDGLQGGLVELRRVPVEFPGAEARLLLVRETTLHDYGQTGVGGFRIPRTPRFGSGNK